MSAYLARAAARARAARGHLVAAFTPRPAPPGTINRHIIDLEKWALLDSRDVRYAFKDACRQYALSWRVVFMSKPERAALQRQLDDELAVREGRTPPSVVEAQEREAAAKAAAAATDGPAAVKPGDADAPPVVTPEMLREFAAKFGTRLNDVVRDPRMKARMLSGLHRATEASRAVLDEFLVGYQQGKNEEIRAHVEEELAAAKQRERVQEEELAAARLATQQQQQQQAGADATAAVASTTAATTPPLATPPVGASAVAAVAGGAVPPPAASASGQPLA